MTNVAAAMEYAQTFEREAMKKRLSESDLEAPTLIDVVARHEKEIQELKRLVTPMMELNQQMPTKIVGPNLVGILNAAGFYQKKEWVGLTGVEINHIFAVNVGYPERMMQEVEALLKEKNT